MSDKKDGKIHDWDQATNVEKLKAELASCVSTLEKHANDLSKEEGGRLAAALHSAGHIKERVEVDYGHDFDIAAEIAEQITLVMILREQILVGGEIKQGASITEVQKVVSACGSMISTLMKHHKEIQSMDRHRAMENAVVDTLKEINDEYPDSDIVAKYLNLLESKLENIK